MSHAARIERLAARLPELGVDALVVTHLVNLRYLTGFSGSNGVLVVRSGGAVFLTDFRYLERVEPLRAFVDVRRAHQEIVRDTSRRLGELAPGAGRIGFEAAHLSVAAHEVLREGAGAAELVPLVGAVEGLRAVKDAGEQEAVRRAAAPIEPVLRALAGEGLAGRTEADVAWSIQELFHQQGADAAAFPTIVASGAAGAQPHAVPRREAIPAATLVTIDLGCVLDGYASDCTRTFATGELPGDLAEAYEVCLRAQLEGMAAVRAGVSAGDVDARARGLIAREGHGEHFGHNTGHGVGLDIHEAPRLAPGASATLETGMVVTIEPGIYLPGRGGVRIEDLVIVTEDGCERLTGYPKELTRVD
jgi:Xaa-Pro aminopeptidase